MATANETLISVKGLKKHFGKLQVLKGVDIDIHSGEVVVVIGPSGSGKSTFLRCINLLETPTEGDVIFEGKSVMKAGKDINVLRERIGMVFQQFNLFPHLTVLENICIAPMKVKKVPRAQIERTAMELLARVGLAEKAKAYPGQLSGGQKQRVAIAGVLAMKPKCIVLDEPTAMLDPQGRREVIETVERLNREEGMTVVLITHHMDEATHAGRVVAMNDGKIVADGTPAEVFSQVELLRSVGLSVPETTELLYALRADGFDLPLDALSIDQCAQALYDRIKA